MANAIRYSPAKDIGELKVILDNFSKLKFNIIIPTIKIITDAGVLAFAHDITIYDATYIALANHLKCEFVTADGKLQRKVKDSLDFVKLLHEATL